MNSAQQTQFIKIKDNIYYSQSDSIGQGSFGKVYSGLYLDPQTNKERKCAIKIISKQTNRNPSEKNKYYENEIKICKLIKDKCTKFHQQTQNERLNIVEILDIHYDDEFAYIVMEFCQYTLESFKYNTQINRVNLVQSIEFTEQILKGIAFLHDCEIIHRDIKPDNIFIVENQQTNELILKIGDFSISTTGDNLQVIQKQFNIFMVQMIF